MVGVGFGEDGVIKRVLGIKPGEMLEAQKQAKNEGGGERGAPSKQAEKAETSRNSGINCKQWERNVQDGT